MWVNPGDNSPIGLIVSIDSKSGTSRRHWPEQSVTMSRWIVLAVPDNFRNDSVVLTIALTDGNMSLLPRIVLLESWRGEENACETLIFNASKTRWVGVILRRKRIHKPTLWE